MSERISIKGKGDELFFGAADRSETVEHENQQPSSMRASQPAASPARLPAGQPASMQATKPASVQASAEIQSEKMPMDPSLRRRLRDLLTREHPVHNSYRFTPDELDALRDVVYELEVKRGIKITKNDLVRLGLNWVMEDYRSNGKQSVVAQVCGERPPE